MRRKDDDACRATAERINRIRPQWLVMWGCYSGLYWAFPLFETRTRVLIHAGYPNALVARMDEAEQKSRVWPDREGVNDRGTEAG